MNLPQNKKETFGNIVAELIKLDNIVAVVLGGSFATGRATENSDLDIGIYYNEKKPFNIEEIKRIAEKQSVENVPIVTDFYQWGPWVNGGAWIHTESGKVDFLYRNLDQVKSTIESAISGEWQKHYEQQPPYGFSSVIYLAEIENCIPVFDTEDIISKLKSSIKNYPPKLKETIIQQGLWAAEFTLINAVDFAEKDDFYNTFGSITRTVKNIVDVLFAINETYPIGDKKAIEILSKLSLSPNNLASRVNTTLTADKNSLSENIFLLRRLFDDVVELTDGVYKPQFDFKK
ncbi:nucleotidyltransferase domain-containing protein [Sphingobacterium sp. SGR-19]|uniref:nucleotidyltransferase domain-containing protein n=1 Tax=Sphingobacterium sp. SGR-19 TaxID=2710886 RepID=UPI0013ECAE22|nr:nucleotidyltransferase domain-containing protein [Sphingobacterium sp. SGR-19]NGM67382.1 DUF4037 domain-containing protein [Sphingobacterium sp. SGR-19]